MHANHAGSDSCEDSAPRRGKAFSAKDFLAIGSRTTIDVTLASLTKEGEIRRIRHGLCDMPKFNPALGGKLNPDIDEAAGAIARRQRWKIVPEGSWAANLLGLSTQVPSRSFEALAGRLLFKGGTSLSKIFHAINRFSEDIDLAVDYVALGFTGEKDPRREGIAGS